MTRFFATTFRGVEDISAEEIVATTGATIDDAPYRRVQFTLQANFGSLLRLRTVDDLFVTIGHWQGVTRQRSSLDLIAEKAGAMPLDAVLPVIGEVRALPATPLFSVTASHVGKRNYSSDEIKQHVADALTASRPWQYTQNDADADLNVRLFIEGEGVDVGARLAKGPLYKRDYAVADYPGSLKPPLAAALIRIAAPRAGQILLDPFCGSGTILLESLPLGLQILAGDISSHAVESCRNRNLDVRQWDARSLPLEDSSVDRIVSNLPWGDQSVIKTESAGFYHDICREMERVLKPDGKIVLLTTLAEQVQFSSLRLELNREISLFGKRPAILKFC